jgi:hypothetical protein
LDFFFFFFFFFSQVSSSSFSETGGVNVKFDGSGEYVVPRIARLSMTGITFKRNSPGKMFTFNAPDTIRFEQCTFIHTDVGSTAIFIDDETYDFNYPLNVAFVGCQFDTVGPAVTISLSRPNSVVNIDFIDAVFTTGDNAAASKVAVVVNKTALAHVTVRQSAGQSTVKSFVNVGSTSSLLSVSGASLTLDNVDFSGVVGGAVATKNAPSITVNKSRFTDVAAHGLKVETGASSTLLNVTNSTFKQVTKALLVSGDTSGLMTTTVSNSLFDTCTGGAIKTAKSGGTFRNVVIQNCNSTQFGGAISAEPLPNRTVILDSCKIISSSASSDLIAISDAPVEMSDCTLSANAVQSGSIVSAQAGLKVTKSSFANNAASFQVFTSGDLTVEDVSFVSSRPHVNTNVAQQPFDMALIGENRRGEFANVTSSQSTLASLITESPVHFVRAASQLRAIVLNKPVVLNVTVPLTLALCDKALPAVNATKLAGALVGSVGDQLVVAPSGTLTVMRGIGCDAFVSGSSAVVNGSLTLRSYGGAFNLTRAFSGTGTLKLGVRGANVTNGEVDLANFASKATFGALELTVAISRTPPVGTVITSLTFPRDSNFGTLPEGFAINETAITYTVTVSCSQSCNNGACIANEMCMCTAGWADSDTGKCDKSLATTPGEQLSTTGGSTTAGTDKVATPNSSLPIEIIAPAVAGGVLLLVAIVVIICCVVNKRKKAKQSQGGAALEQRGQSGAYNTVDSKGTVTYGALPSDAERITTATGKEVVAVEWEEGSSEE